MLRESRFCKVENMCVMDKETTLLYFSGPYGGAGLRETGATRADASYAGVENYTLPCNTITSIMLKNKAKEVDFLSLDIEGAEPYAITGIDFSLVTIHVLVIETVRGTSVNEGFDAARKKLFDNGYERVAGLFTRILKADEPRTSDEVFILRSSPYYARFQTWKAGMCARSEVAAAGQFKTTLQSFCSDHLSAA